MSSIKPTNPWNLGQTAAALRDGRTYLGGVEVHFIILLVSCQILVFVVDGRSYQHHPVAVFFTAGVKTHHHTILLENLLIGRGGGLKREGS